MFHFSRKTFATLILALLAAITMIFSQTFMASAQVTPSHTTVIHVSSTPVPAPPGVDTNDKNAPSPSKDHIIYVPRGSSKITPNLVNNCGIVTCSLYFSRWETLEIATWGPVVVLNLGWVPGWVGFILTLGAAFIQERAKVAANFNSCLRIRYTVGFAVVGVYVDNSEFCHD